jgi:hypothetical protein
MPFGKQLSPLLLLSSDFVLQNLVFFRFAFVSALRIHSCNSRAGDDGGPLPASPQEAVTVTTVKGDRIRAISVKTFVLSILTSDVVAAAVCHGLYLNVSYVCLPYFFLKVI